MNKIALITGASRGIGAATAKLLANDGYSLGINYVQDKNAADALVDEIRALGVKAIAIQADVAVESDILRMFADVDEKLGTLTALVNNAGILDKQIPIAQITQARLQRVFSTNVFGSFLCAREAVKRMSTEFGGQGGNIVNISSIASRLGSPNEYVDYAASKGAIDTFTIGLAKEVALKGIRVNCVRPAFVYTEIHALSGEPDRVERVKEFVPMKRGGTVEEVAEAILWLVSDKSSYTTGSFIDVTGGG